MPMQHLNANILTIISDLRVFIFSALIFKIIQKRTVYCGMSLRMEVLARVPPVFNLSGVVEAVVL